MGSEPSVPTMWKREVWFHRKEIKETKKAAVPRVFFCSYPPQINHIITDEPHYSEG